MEQGDQESRIRRAIAGFDVLLVGGERRHEAIDRLRSALGLRNAVHVATRRVDPSARCFASALRNPELVLVVCIRALCRTQHGKDLRAMCRQAGLPWLDTSRIPHPRQLLATLAGGPVGRAVLHQSACLRGRTVLRGGAA
jgi:hypothetical protein